MVTSSSSSCSSLSWWTLIEFTDVIFVKMNKWKVLLLPLFYRWRNWGLGRLHNGRFCFCFCFFGCKQQKETLASRKGEWPQEVWNMEEVRSGQHGGRWTCVFPGDTLPSTTPSLWTSRLLFVKYLLRSYYVPGPRLSTRDIMLNQKPGTIPALMMLWCLQPSEKTH